MVLDPIILRGGAYIVMRLETKRLFLIYLVLSSHDFVENFHKHLLFENNHYYF